MPQKRAQKKPTTQTKTQTPTSSSGPGAAGPPAPGDSLPFSHQLGSMRAATEGRPLPSVSAIAEERPEPFRVLVSTLISLRTKDDVTRTASERLLEVADSPERLSSCREEEIAAAIYPAGFYKTKAARLKEIARILLERYDGAVPHTEAELLALPGVGRKTANLVLSVGFGIPAICVDIHVHRISNRLGWVSSNTPDETERQLRAAVPRELWVGLNKTLVAFGQHICTPTSPRCSLCPQESVCPKHGVARSR